MMVESDRKKKKEDITTAQNISKNNKNYFQLYLPTTLSVFTYFSRKMMQAFLLTHPSANLL